MKGIYIAAGHPTRKAAIDAARSVAHAGFDFLEIGIPYNDPVADGPVIASALDAAVKNGITPSDVFDDIDSLSDIGIPVYIMTYGNIILKAGPEKITGRLHGKVSGLIIADLPNRMGSFLTERGLGIPIVPFVTPETREKDLEIMAGSSADFIYLVGLRGVTGSQADFGSPVLLRQIEMIRKVTDKKIVLGFGIRNRDDARQALSIADGFVAGTGAVKKQGNREELEKFLEELAGA